MLLLELLQLVRGLKQHHALLPWGLHRPLMWLPGRSSIQRSDFS
jgi:hypothetical protein